MMVFERGTSQANKQKDPFFLVIFKSRVNIDGWMYVLLEWCVWGWMATRPNANTKEEQGEMHKYDRVESILSMNCHR